MAFWSNCILDATRNIPSQKLTNRTWKWMIRNDRFLLGPFLPIFRCEMLVHGTLDGQNPKPPHGMYKTLLKMGYTTISTVNFRECSSCLIAVSISNLDSPPLVVSDLKISALNRLLTSLRGRVPWNAVETPGPSVTWCSDANPGVWACGRFAGEFLGGKNHPWT